MDEDEKIRAAAVRSIVREGRRATLFRSLYKRRNEKEPPDLKDQAAGVQKDEPREAGGMETRSSY